MGSLNINLDTIFRSNVNIFLHFVVDSAWFACKIYQILNILLCQIQINPREREIKQGYIFVFPRPTTNLISQFTFLNANPSWKMVKFICEWGEGEKYGLTPCKIYTPVCV